MPWDSKEFPTDCWRYEYRDGGGPGLGQMAPPATQIMFRQMKMATT